ncbi:DUF6122 family protein [Wenyingzhuangia sp. IMCC45533]
MLRFFIHYGLHLVFPALIAYFYNKQLWKKNWLILLSTMLIDIDHLFANPVYDPNRCSINFHYLHSFPLAYIYFVLLAMKKTRLWATGLIFHLITDYIDCFLK